MRDTAAIGSTYADEAMVGSNANRPQYQAMLAVAKRKEFQVLIVDELPRLMRDQVETELTIRRLEFDGICVIGVSDGYDSNHAQALEKSSTPFRA